MTLFRWDCPGCHQTSLIDATGACQNIVSSRKTCGFRLPIEYQLGNTKYRNKFEKHTTPPPSGVTGMWSWTANSGDYAQHQEWTLASGSLQLDTNQGYLFLFGTPQGANPIASLYSSDPGTVIAASGVIMPLNSKPQNIHHHYGNYEEHFEQIAAGPNLTIEAPNTHHHDFRVYDAEKLFYRFDPLTGSGQRFT